MAILSEHERRKRTVADENGNHIPISEWTHADSVELPNGLNLAESVVYLTQAKYDALGDEKYTDNVEYRITDAVSEIHGSVVGVKGNAESSYRDGEVNITAEDIGLGNVPTHLVDTVSHITSDERTKWDGYETSINELNTKVILSGAKSITCGRDNTYNRDYYRITRTDGSIRQLEWYDDHIRVADYDQNTGTWEYLFKVYPMMRETTLELNTTTLANAQILKQNSFADYEFVDLYLACWGSSLPCIRIFPHFSELSHCIGFNMVSSDGNPSIFSIKFTTYGRYFINVIVKRYTGNSWADISDNSEIMIRKVIGYK